MKIKYLAMAIAAIAAQSAFALDAASTRAIQNGTDANGVVVYLTGASATRPGIYADPASANSALKSLCVANTMTAFASTDGNVTAYSCTIKSATSLGGIDAGFVANFAGKNLLLGLSVIDGSFTAIKSMSPNASERNNQIDFNTTPNASGQYGFLASAPVTAGGFLDVNPELFAGQSLSFTPDYTPVTGFGAGQSFGLVVSKALYADLQVAQGLTSCTSADLTPACQPSITKSQYASLINVQNAGSANWGVLGLAPTDGRAVVNICRRGDTSGTQASSDSFFLAARCGVRSGTPSALSDSTAGQYVVTEGSTTGEAKNCLSGLTPNGKAVIAGVSQAAYYAVGVVSVENKNAATDMWRYVKLDGVAIADQAAGGFNRQAAVDMKYDFNEEFGYVKNNALADKASILDGLASQLVDPTVVGGAAGGGTGTGLLGLFVSPLSGITHSSNPVVSKSTRYGDACLPSSYAF